MDKDAKQPAPSDVAMMQQLLRSMGVEEYEPRVVNQLLDFMYRYSTDVLLDAECYAQHAGKPAGSVDLDDVMLAVQARAGQEFVQPPSLDTLADLAKQVNSQPVPEPSAANKHGLRLPPERDCITQPNQQLVLPDSAAGGGSGADGAAAR